MSLIIEFGEPQHGWLEVRVDLNGQSVEMSASDVPCDSLHQLVSSLNLIIQGGTDEEVIWSLEPEWYTWRFARSDDQVVFTIVHGSHLLLEGRLPTNELIAACTRALKQLKSCKVWEKEGARPNWSWPFPDASFGRLLALVNR